MSKKYKKYIGAAVSIFAPMFAPWAAGALAGSSFLGPAAQAAAAAGTSSLATTAASGVLGALGSAAGANLQGQDWRQSAVLGGLTGGFLGATGGGFGGGVKGGVGATELGRAKIAEQEFLKSAADKLAFSSGAPTGTVGAGAGAGAGETAAPTFMQRLADVSPGTLIQSGTQLALGAAGMSQEDKMLAAQQAEMERQRALEQEQFNRQMQAAEEMKGMAAQYDPQRVGLSEANIYGRQLEQQRREQLRKLTPGQEGRREAIGRQFDIAKATGRSTGYAQGYGAGLDLQGKFLSAAQGLYPTNIPGSARPSLSDIAEVRRATGEQVKSATAALEPITASMYPESKKKSKREETA